MPSSATELAASLHACAVEIARVGKALAARDWTPATSGNFSMRIDAAHVAITRSGCDKGALTPDDVMALTLDGRPLDPAFKPSAETALHLQLYRCLPATGAILHTHSRHQSVASRAFARRGAIVLRGWELQKAIEGYDSHASELSVPIFPNSQAMPDIEARVDAWLDAGRPLSAYLIEGHGLYTWGHDMQQAQRHLEALDFLLACELDLQRFGDVQ